MADQRQDDFFVEGDSSFHTTHWSIVVGASQPETRRRSLALLCERYWMPLYAYLRRTGHSSHDAQDLTQSFFTTLLECDKCIAGADESRGRFRAYLLGSLKHFVANHRTQRRASKRGGGQVHLSLNYHAAEAWYGIEPVDTQTPESIFRRRWALSLLECVLNRLGAEYEAKGKGEIFQELKGCLTGNAVDITYDQLAVQLSMSSGAVKTAAHRLRKRYRELLKAEISETVASPDEVDDEINQLLTALSG
ncbi:MAG: sigma-70 family RNA polymerase sigma factor [Planctomycetaceae bacterium]|nr:sigma-70 family RNA polymerase sigma factor [Planctomycetales bacterium]MCB9922478.1 sigma-70 family RNA polymerase sigma factor [Planctomycetaceae bacterium]